MLPAECLDESCAVLLVGLTLPDHTVGVAAPVRRRVVVFVEREMLDVDAVVRQQEVREILAPLRRGCWMLILGLVLEVDAVFGQEVRDLELLDALDQIPAEGAQLDAAPVGLVVVVRLEIERQ